MFFLKTPFLVNAFLMMIFFESPFGKVFMDIDKLRQQMIERQKKFLEKYQSEFIKSEDEN